MVLTRSQSKKVACNTKTSAKRASESDSIINDSAVWRRIKIVDFPSKKNVIEPKDPSETSSPLSHYSTESESNYTSSLHSFSTESESNYTSSSSTECASNSNDFFDFDEDRIKKEFEIYKKSDEWNKNAFYDYLYENYIKKLLTFSDKQEYSPGEWSSYLIELVKSCPDEDKPLLVEMYALEPYVGKCSFRNLPRTISRVVYLDGSDYYTGVRCAEIMYDLVSLYINMDNKAFKSANEIIDYLKEMMVNLDE